MVALDPCCWKWHSSRLQRSRSSLFANLRRFFKSLLLLWIRTGDDRARFSQPKLKLVKQSLALAHAQSHLLRQPNVIRQKFSIPEVLSIPECTRRFSKIGIQDLKLLGSQPLRAPGSFLIFQATEPSCLETLNPSLHIPHFIAGHASVSQQHSMQPVIIQRFFGPKDFIPQSDFHYVSIGNLQSFHRTPPLEFLIHEGW